MRGAIKDYAVCALLGALLAWGFVCGLERQTDIKWGERCVRGDVPTEFCPETTSRVGMLSGIRRNNTQAPERHGDMGGLSSSSSDTPFTPSPLNAFSFFGGE